ncbi:HAMP domain-containing histidine kinase [Paenibacillus sp. N1-5-1-14]|uniref:sensor histidine kinase n=1 Tax=Paenibacillus radicibacter TaxID=2972488 RepID=UPI0021597BA4|nr:HAMP domain-containing sensor histidine kinase [Paenibacillus radicibacter]MCR8642656.1 HAMP domain-containing histidine kinase [Paenibacillus radicibacter]
MKLIHQINLAFGVLLVLVFSVTAVIIHTVLLDHFMGKQQDELQELSNNLSITMSQRAVRMPEEISTLTVTNNVEAILLDANNQVISTTIKTIDGVTGVTDVVQGISTAMPINEDMKRIIAGQDIRYLTSSAVTDYGHLTLVSSVSKIKEIEQKLFGQLLIVLCVGFALVYLLSLLITKRLIHPLMLLREELKKVKCRQFSGVQRIQAGGEIGVVAETVYDLAKELERYHQVQKQFFQNASHELKSPMMSITGYAEAIKDGYIAGEGVSRGLDIIMSEGKRVKKLVTEMTLLAKLDSEENIFQFEEVALTDMILETQERVNPTIMKKQLELNVHYHIESPDSITIRADRDKLLQALLNVVNNAARYAKEQIDIHVYQQGVRVQISVQDDGMGISEQLLPTLFHRFVKGKDGESGLGLAIARAIVERCGGGITAHNQPEGGARLEFDFPLYRCKSL